MNENFYYESYKIISGEKHCYIPYGRGGRFVNQIQFKKHFIKKMKESIKKIVWMNYDNKKLLRNNVDKYYNKYGKKCKYNPNEVVGFMIEDFKMNP
jgi:hypothetical protein